mmetsp:Transcript_18722/g.46505  ORF Transcript_18722/g.46505 Transcript_18722/m.46505 type:complete len:81 (+) Transcript_18722:297-539(+)
MMNDEDKALREILPMTAYYKKYIYMKSVKQPENDFSRLHLFLQYATTSKSLHCRVYYYMNAKSSKDRLVKKTWREMLLTV